MIKIAICDDEQRFIDRLQGLIDQYSKERDIEFRVSVFRDGIELTENYNTDLDLIFLDIRMDRMNGLKAAEKIRSMDGKVTIIFLTSLAQYAIEGYKYRAANYIIKPIQYPRLKAELDTWIRMYRKDDEEYLLISNDSGKYKLFHDTIRYIETNKRNLLIHTEEGDVDCYRSMKNIMPELEGKGFARCHASYIVNLCFVAKVEKLEIQLISGEIIPISQSKRKEFMECLTEYWGDRL